MLTGLLKGHRKASHVIRVVLQPTYDSLYKSNAVPYSFQLNFVYVYNIDWLSNELLWRINKLKVGLWCIIWLSWLFGLNTPYISVFSPNTRKYGPEITPYLETFHAVIYIYIYIYIYVYKRKNSLEGSLERVLFAAEPELPKMLVPGLPQISSNVNICARKLKQLCSECDQLHGALIYPHFIGLILICFLLIIPAVNYVINGFFSSRTTLRVITIMDLHNGGKKLLQLLLKIDS